MNAAPHVGYHRTHTNIMIKTRADILVMGFPLITTGVMVSTVSGAYRRGVSLEATCVTLIAVKSWG